MNGNAKNNAVNTNIFTGKSGFSPVNPFSVKSQIPFTQNQKRLNGYDSTILNNSKFNSVEEQELSIDYRIKEKEQAITTLDDFVTAEPDLIITPAVQKHIKDLVRDING